MDNLKNLFLTSNIFMLIFISFLYIAPTVQASTLSAEQKGISILNSVVGVDLSKYAVSSNTYAQTQTPFGISQSVIYNLTSINSKLRVSCTFNNGNLQILQVLDVIGATNLAASQPVSNTVAAKSFLERYQQYTSIQKYDQLKSSLSSINPNRNTTQVTEDSTLEVTALSSGYTNFKWTYTVNGILAPTKFLSLGFNNNSLSYFVDNWQSQTIGSTKINLSEDQAKSIAINVAKTWSLSVGLDKVNINKFNESNIAFAALLFDYPSHTNVSLSGDPSVLYPVWRVGVQLDKWYGDLYGIEVDMNADTGQIISTREALSTLHPLNDTNLSSKYIDSSQTAIVQTTTSNETIPLIWLILLISVGVSTPALLLVTKKNSKMIKFNIIISRLSKNLHKQLIPLTGGLLVCVLLMPSLLFLYTIPSVSATPTGTAVIWGAESIGQLSGQQEPYFYWRKTFPEIVCQQSTANAISGWFSNYGFLITVGLAPLGKVLINKVIPGHFATI